MYFLKFTSFPLIIISRNTILRLNTVFNPTTDFLALHCDRRDFESLREYKNDFCYSNSQRNFHGMSVRLDG